MEKELKEFTIKFCVPEGGMLVQAFVKAILPHLVSPSAESPSAANPLVRTLLKAFSTDLNQPSAETLQASSVNQEKPISKKEACRFLSCSAPTLTKWMANGTIPFSRKGRRVYFFKSHIIKSLGQPINATKEGKRCRF